MGKLIVLIPGNNKVTNKEAISEKNCIRSTNKNAIKIGFEMRDIIKCNESETMHSDADIH